jgi:hypothetical protein
VPKALGRSQKKMKLKDIKLKTCPFCDGEGVLIHSKPDDGYIYSEGVHAFVKCKECDACGPMPDVEYNHAASGYPGRMKAIEGYDIPCVVVKKYKVGQRLSKIDGTEGGGYLLKLAVRADQYLYLGDYIEDSEQTFVNLGIRPYSDKCIYVFNEKDIPAARKQILKNKIAYLQSELNYFKRRLDEENNNDEKV